MLQFETSERGGVLIVAFEEGDDSRHEHQTAQRQGLYQEIEARGDQRYAFDLGSIRYLTSSDIGYLITLRRRIAARQGRVVLFAVDPYLLDLFGTLRLDRLFEIADDIDGALARLASPPSP